MLLHEVELDERTTVAIRDQKLFVNDHLRCAVAMHFKLADLLLVFNVPDAMLAVDAGADNVAIINDLNLVNDRMRLHIDLQNLVSLCAVQH